MALPSHPSPDLPASASCSRAGAGAALPDPAGSAPCARAVTHKLHREIVLLAGWGRAILLQIAHPLVAWGVAEHSSFLRDRRGWWARLRRTVDAMLALTFGTPEEAAHVAAGINAMHGLVHGRLREPQGLFPAGTAYAATDPALLRWVHATLVDSSLLAYELYVGPLTPEERDRYCAEASGIEPLLRIPAGFLPRSTAELHRYLARTLASGEIAVTDTARSLAREIVSPQVPRVLQPLVALARLPTIGLLPPLLREAYGFRWDARQEAALQHSARLTRALLPLAPPPLRYWPAARRRQP